MPWAFGWSNKKGSKLTLNEWRYPNRHCIVIGGVIMHGCQLAFSDPHCEFDPLLPALPHPCARDQTQVLTRSKWLHYSSSPPL